MLCQNGTIASSARFLRFRRFPTNLGFVVSGGAFVFSNLGFANHPRWAVFVKTLFYQTGFGVSFAARLGGMIVT